MVLFVAFFYVICRLDDRRFWNSFPNNFSYPEKYAFLSLLKLRTTQNYEMIIFWLRNYSSCWRVVKSSGTTLDSFFPVLVAWLVQATYGDFQELSLTVAESMVKYPSRIALADMVGAVSKISAFRPQGPQFNPSSAEIWIFVRPSFPPKLTQLSILPGKVNEYQRLLGAYLQ